MTGIASDSSPNKNAGYTNSIGYSNIQVYIDVGNVKCADVGNVQMCGCEDVCGFEDVRMCRREDVRICRCGYFGNGAASARVMFGFNLTNLEGPCSYKPSGSIFIPKTSFSALLAE